MKNLNLNNGMQDERFNYAFAITKKLSNAYTLTFLSIQENVMSQMPH